MSKIILVVALSVIITFPLHSQQEGITVNNGNVGVGTLTPTTDLEILSAGSVRLKLSSDIPSYTEFRKNHNQLRIFSVSDANSLIDINPHSLSNGNQAVRIFRESNSTGASYLDMFIGNGSTTLNNRIGAKGVHSYFNSHYKTLNLGIGLNNPTAQLHVKSGQPTNEHTIIAQSDNASANYISTYAGVYIRNGNETNGNYARLNFGDNSNTAGSVGVQIQNHSNDYGDLVFWTRGPSGFSEKLRINQHGNVSLGSPSLSSGSKVLSIGNGSAPTTDPVNGIQIYAADINGKSELHVRDEDGDVSVLSNSGQLTALHGTMSANANIPTNLVWTNGPSVVLTPGTWMVTCNLSLHKSGFGLTDWYARISDGATHYSGGMTKTDSANPQRTTMSMTSLITVTSNTTIYGQATSSATSGALIRAVVNRDGVYNASTISALKVSD